MTPAAGAAASSSPPTPAPPGPGPGGPRSSVPGPRPAAPAPPMGHLVRPPDPPAVHPSTRRNHNPGSGTKAWKISLQPPGHRKAACPKCRENFGHGDIRVGSAAAGNKASFHLLCLDAALPPVEQMVGWGDLSEYEKGTTRTLYASHRSARGGDAEVQAPKRLRQERPTRSVQLQLPFATPTQARAVLHADLDAERVEQLVHRGRAVVCVAAFVPVAPRDLRAGCQPRVS